ncbi:hypothetical protein BJX70DRAFT_22758 [Aspergillus crustosus]
MEIYLSLSIVCQVTSSLKFIIAVYEDKDGVSYTDGSAKGTFKTKTPVSGSTDSSSQSQSQVRRHSQSQSQKNRSVSVSVSAGDRVRLIPGELDVERAQRRERERGEESGSGGLRILRSVQWSIRDEGEIELDERVGADGAVRRTEFD